MLEGSEGSTFPVIFFDGEREFHIGHVRIFPKQVYKTFLYFISQQIRISPSQISVFLVDSNNLTKTLISTKTSFSRLSAQRDCFLLAILKRPRPRNPYQESYPVPTHYQFVPQNVTLLQPHHHHINYDSHFYHQIAQPYFNPNEGFPRTQQAHPKMIMKYCAECTNADKNGKLADFHHCVTDQVVKEPRPCTFGPIGPSSR